MALSLKAIQAKNSLSDGGLWLIPLTIYSPELDMTFRLVANTEDLVWNGERFQAFPIKIGELKEAIKGQLPSLQLQVSNVQRMLQGYIEQDPNFGSNWQVTLEVVYIPDPEREGDVTHDGPSELSMNFISTGVSCTEQWVTINLGMENPLRLQCPHRKFAPHTCQAQFKNPETGCTYDGTEYTTCDKSIEACKARFGEDALLPFVGFPAIPVGHGVFKI